MQNTLGSLAKIGDALSRTSRKQKRSTREDICMAAYGYGGVTDRAFVAFDRELDDGAWKGIALKKADEQASENAALLLNAPQPVIWKLRLRWGSAGVLTALGATSLAELDGSWDSAQRRLFHRVAAGVDSEDADVRAAADRLSAQILAGTGVAQTQYDFDAEVDFGLNQIARGSACFRGHRAIWGDGSLLFQSPSSPRARAVRWVGPGSCPP